MNTAIAPNVAGIFPSNGWKNLIRLCQPVFPASPVKHSPFAAPLKQSGENHDQTAAVIRIIQKRLCCPVPAHCYRHQTAVAPGWMPLSQPFAIRSAAAACSSISRITRERAATGSRNSTSAAATTSPCRTGRINQAGTTSVSNGPGPKLVETCATEILNGALTPSDT